MVICPDFLLSSATFIFRPVLTAFISSRVLTSYIFSLVLTSYIFRLELTAHLYPGTSYIPQVLTVYVFRPVLSVCIFTSVLTAHLPPSIYILYFLPSTEIAYFQLTTDSLSFYASTSYIPPPTCKDEMSVLSGKYTMSVLGEIWCIYWGKYGLSLRQKYKLIVLGGTHKLSALGGYKMYSTGY